MKKILLCAGLIMLFVVTISVYLKLNYKNTASSQSLDGTQQIHLVQDEQTIQIKEDKSSAEDILKVAHEYKIDTTDLSNDEILQEISARRKSKNDFFYEEAKRYNIDTTNLTVEEIIEIVKRLNLQEYLGQTK
ncbi:hypothetical protein [Paenibacillus koleovorans]|uniref:hypothetical protein n=1 Tax=Paenibacillus koleovorans TaxID=121608 RepID=UPI000FDBC91A|nr:hypothetical protein [Paenibacillus koleovorans]